MKNKSDTRLKARVPQEKKCTKCGTTSTPQWRNRGTNRMCNACGIKDQAERRKATKRSPEPEDLTATPVKSAKTQQGGSPQSGTTHAPETPNLTNILAALLPFGNMPTPACEGGGATNEAGSSPQAPAPSAPATIDPLLGVPFDLFDLPLDLEEAHVTQQAQQLNIFPTSSILGSLMRHMHQPYAGQVSLLGGAAAAPQMVPTGQLHEEPDAQASAEDVSSSLRMEQPVPENADGSKLASTPVEHSSDSAKSKEPRAEQSPRAMPEWPSIQSFMPWDISASAEQAAEPAGPAGAQSLRLERGGRTVVEPASGRVVKTLAALPDVQLLHQSCAGSSGVVMEHVCPGLTLTLQLVTSDSHEAASAGSRQGEAMDARVLARVSMSHERSGVVVTYLDDVQLGKGHTVPHLVRGCPAWDSGDGWVVLFGDAFELEGFKGAIAQAPGHIRRCEMQS